MFTFTRLRNWYSGAKAGHVNNGKKKHVAVLAFPFGTHAAPLLSLVRRIAAETPNVTFSFFSTSQANAKLFSGSSDHDEFLSNIKHYNIQDGIPENHVPSGNPHETITLFINSMQINYKSVMDEVAAETGEKFTCLVTDAFYWFGADLAKEINAKWIPLWTAGPHSLLTHVYTDLIREHFQVNEDHEVQNFDFVPGFPELRACDLPEMIIDDDIKEPFGTMLHKMGLELPRATAVAINSFDTGHNPIENELKSKFKSLLNVGPFILTTPQRTFSDEYGCIPWLNEQESSSVVYISFGSVVIPPPHELTALAEALEESEFPFILAFRGNPEENLPKGFMERTKTKGKIVAWAPQLEILKHSAIGVCLTHSGWNSVLDCIVGGVPMITRPFLGDQKLNARMIESVWEIGVGVDNEIFTKESVLKALEITMSSEKAKIMRQKILKLKEFALEAVQQNGTSTKNFNTLTQIVTS